MIVMIPKVNLGLEKCDLCFMIYSQVSLNYPSPRDINSTNLSRLTSVGDTCDPRNSSCCFFKSQ